MTQFAKRNLFSNVYFLAAKTLSNLLLLPVLMASNSDEQLVAWFLVYSLVTFVTALDFGLVSVVTRVFSYSVSDFTKITEITILGARSRSPLFHDPFLRSKVHKLYLRVAMIASVFVTLIFILIALEARGGYATEQMMAALLCGGIASFFLLYVNFYIACLNAGGQYSSVQVYKGTSYVGALFASYVSVFFMDLSASYVAIIFFFTVCIGHIPILFRFRCAFGTIDTILFDRSESHKLNSYIFSSVVKTALGNIVIIGLQQFMGLYFVTTRSANDVAAFFTSLQVLRSINTFSRAPLYSQLPNVYDKVIVNETGTMSVLKRSACVGCIFFVSGVGLYAVLADYVFVNFPFLNHFQLSYVFWALAVYFLLELIGAFYVELHTVWGVILWTRVSLATLLLFFALVFLGAPIFGHHAVLWGATISYLLGFIPVAIYYSRKETKSWSVSNG